MFWFRRNPPEYRYNRLKNVRVHLSTMVVERKYVVKLRGKTTEVWQRVDYKTTHKLKEPRICPPEYLARLCRDAF